jgi:hypothetical protein
MCVSRATVASKSTSVSNTEIRRGFPRRMKIEPPRPSRGGFLLPPPPRSAFKAPDQRDRVRRMSEDPTSFADRLRAALLSAALIAAPLVPAYAGAEADPPADSPHDFSKEAEEMSEATLNAIEKFNAIVGAMLESFEHWIDDMPRYEAPEVLPNGDIIIRRIPKGATPPSDETEESGVTDL